MSCSSLARLAFAVLGVALITEAAAGDPILLVTARAAVNGLTAYEIPPSAANNG